MKVNLIDKMYRSTDFRVRYLDIVDLCSKILRKISKILIYLLCLAKS